MAKFKTCKVSTSGRKEIFKETLTSGKKKVKLYMLFDPNCKRAYNKTYKAFLKKNRGTKPDYSDENIPCVVFYFLSQTMKEVMAPYTHFFKDKITVSITPNIVKGHVETMAYYPGMSTKTRVVLSIEWYHIIETIVHPYFKSGKINHKYLAASILHELVGH